MYLMMIFNLNGKYLKLMFSPITIISLNDGIQSVKRVSVNKFKSKINQIGFGTI